MSRRTGVPIALVTVGLTGCGGSDTRGSVAESLLIVADLSGEWSVNLGSDDMQLPESGEITEEQREYLPTMELCNAASQESKDAADALEWEAFRQFDMMVDDPVDVPRDREVLTSLAVVEVVLGVLEPLIDQQMVDDITATAVAKIS